MIRSIIVLIASMLIGNVAQAQSADRPLIVTPPPTSASCTTVNAHWEGDVWVGTQTVCKYENRTEGAAWVQDYWACTVYTGGDCTSWEYRPGHWVKTLQ